MIHRDVLRSLRSVKNQAMSFGVAMEQGRGPFAGLLVARGPGSTEAISRQVFVAGFIARLVRLAGNQRSAADRWSMESR